MSEEINSPKNKNDEIDLLDLFRRMGKALQKGMNALGRITLICIVFLIRKSLWLGLSLVVALLLSFLLRFQSVSIYSSEMTIRSNSVPNSEMISYINRLRTFCIENDTIALSQALSLPMEKVKLIKEIQAFWAIDMLNDGIPDKIDYKNKHNLNDTVNKRMSDRFIVRGRLTVNNEFPLLRQRILDYTSKNSFFQQRNELRLVQNKEIQERLMYDIVQLDSLQKVKYFEETRNKMPKTGGQMIFFQEQPTQLIYSDIYSLYQRKQAIDAENELYKDILTLLDDFTQPAFPINGLFVYFKYLGITCLTICLILLVLISMRKRLYEIYKKY